jgi:hypothetical protein
MGGIYDSKLHLSTVFPEIRKYKRLRMQKMQVVFLSRFQFDQTKFQAGAKVREPSSKCSGLIPVNITIGIGYLSLWRRKVY